MREPDYLICLECDAPCYVFERSEGKATEIVCEACGNEDPDMFLTESELDDLAEEAESGRDRDRRRS